MGETKTANDVWRDIPLFAPDGTSIPKLSENQTADAVTSAIGALSHLLYDEDTPLEASEMLRDEGNRHFKRGKRGYHNAIKKYNDAIQAAGDVKEALAPALLNRAVVEFKLENYGRALQDVEKSLSLSPGNIKAHYRAMLCALHLEKYDVALRHCDGGLQLSATAGTEQGQKDAALFGQQKAVIEKAKSKSSKWAEERQTRLQEESDRKRSVQDMIQSKRITMGLPLFGQQRQYATTEPINREGVWYWPVLLVYPEEIASPGLGDQSDFLEDIAETMKMSEILELVFGEGSLAPEWDMNRMYQPSSPLEMRYRTQWTMELSEADSDDEATFCGSSLPADEVGHWMNVGADTTIEDLVRRRNYITPMFPVLYVVPKHVELL